ncbi:MULTISPECIES: bifunctional diguanylate cyclase/phosphodiesterase [unclassified Clostridium]|uniref:sensor domain-containing protein n=1 Tax=unclassified Clostridium TaxID=2614128 RepID=UPI0002985CB6|nr:MULTISPECIES: bifunctional diguanylate cyclase/phosphodiesterase [unclassified Clostridium]EKQ57651.1 MAG: PAS domain S-box/diguanylate cyclase (GGDEF) domain-containing protein [Clostridium sp. Maddingley MBC34-26]
MMIEENKLNYIEVFKKYKQAVDEVNIAVWEWDLKENKFFLSTAWEKITQYNLNEFSNLFDCIEKSVLHEDKDSAINDLNFFINGSSSLYKSEFRIVTKANEIKWILLNGKMIKNENGESVRLFGLGRDITEEKESKKILTESVYYDFLTKLPNRELFLMDFKTTLEKTKQLNQKGAIVLIDLDNFKSINDTLGHDYGDLMLKVFSQLINVCAKNHGSLYRVGGDEFIILLDEFDSVDNLKELCNSIINYCKKPFELSDKQVYMTTSIGVSTFPQDSTDMNDLLKFADLAMYKSKAVGKNTYTFFELDLIKLYVRRIIIENELKESIKNNELSIVYQPQIDAAENRIVAFEALLRWNNKKLGFVSPAEFIPIAEKTGIIIDIGDWVIEEVCKKIREFKEKKYKFNNVAINVSPIQVKETDFKDKLIKVCEKNEIPLNLLEIEITESTLIDLNEEKIADLYDLIKRDINISIDDFGTGYSSLSYLTVLPINTLKIDKSFVDNIEDEKNRAVIECILSLSKRLRYKVIAEGVEVKEQLKILMNLGCNIIQGYYFSKPVGEDELEKMLINDLGILE